jgi:hypothetical protein
MKKLPAEFVEVVSNGPAAGVIVMDWPTAGPTGGLASVAFTGPPTRRTSPAMALRLDGADGAASRVVM